MHVHKSLIPSTLPVMLRKPQLASTFITKIDYEHDTEKTFGLLLQLEWPTFNTVSLPGTPYFKVKKKKKQLCPFYHDSSRTSRKEKTTNVAGAGMK